MNSKIVLLAGVALGVSTLACSAAVTDPALIITATNAQGTASRTFLLADGIASPVGGYTLNGVPAFNLVSGPNTISNVLSIQEEVSPEGNIGPGNPNRNRVTVGFTAIAGASDTRFTVQSMNFGVAVPGGAARANVTGSLTDRNSNGVQLTPMFGAPGGVGGARFFLDGSEFTTILSGFGDATPGGSANTAESFPVAPGAFFPVFPSATNMNFVLDFTVTAGDEVSVNANFLLSSIIPSPGAVSLLAIGGAIVGLRRRR